MRKATRDNSIKRNYSVFLLCSVAFAITCFGCNYKPSSRYQVEEGDFLIASPLEEPNDYKVEGFKKSYADLPKNYREEDYIINGYENLMPLDVYQKYGVGVYRVYRTSNDNEFKWADYYMMKDEKIYNLSAYGAGDKKPHGLIEVLFTDFNKDGCVEVTASLKANGRSLLSSLDTKTNVFINANTMAYSKHLSFEYDKNEKCINIVKRTLFDSGNAGELIDGYLKIEPYKRDFHLNKEKYVLESINYSVKVTYDKATTTFPLVYDGLWLSFDVITEMTYLGETFTYINENGCKDSVKVIFTQDDYNLSVQEQDCASVVTQFTVEHGEVMTTVNSYQEHYPNLNRLGVYNMIVSYRGENVFVKNALVVS